MNPEVIITNIKKRFTGVSGTVNALLPVQACSLAIAYLGSDMPGASLAADQCHEHFERLTLWQAVQVSGSRVSISLVFTSAAKHRHSWFPRWLISQMDGMISTTPEAGSHVPIPPAGCPTAPILHPAFMHHSDANWVAC